MTFGPLIRRLARAVRGALALVLLTIVPACSGTKPTLVVLVGGAGLSQLGDLGESISAICPDADVIETGGWDGFRANLRNVARDHPNQGLIFIGHSFGCRTIADAAGDIRNIDMVVMIDPAWDDFSLPSTVQSCLWYQRAADDGPERRATIVNGGRPMVVAGDHNGICHSAQVISQVTQAVQAISERRATQMHLQSLLGPR